MAEDAAVGVENLALRHEAYVGIAVDNGQVPCLGVVEGLHHLVHAVVDLDFGRRHRHEGAHAHTAVEVGAEHDVADFVEQHQPDEFALCYRRHQPRRPNCAPSPPLGSRRFRGRHLLLLRTLGLI